MCFPTVASPRRAAHRAIAVLMRIIGIFALLGLRKYSLIYS